MYDVIGMKSDALTYTRFICKKSKQIVEEGDGRDWGNEIEECH